MSGALRVALLAADPERHARLAAMLAEAGHIAVSEDGRADVRLVDLPPGVPAPPGGHPPVLVLADRPDAVADTSVAGASVPGVLRRTVKLAALDAGLRAVAAGLRVREPGAPEPRGFAATSDEPPSAVLTPREMEILAAIGDGLSNKGAARRLGISAHTVKFHLEAVFAKLEVASRAEAVAKGLRRGLIEL